jgi:maltokinase
MSPATQHTPPPSPRLVPDRLFPALRAWLPWQRWYAAKGRPLRDVRIVQQTPIIDRMTEDGPLALLLVVEVLFSDGGDPEFYQVPVGVRATVPRSLEHSVIAGLDDLIVYDALGDSEVVGVLMELIARDIRCGELSFHTEDSGAVGSGGPTLPPGKLLTLPSRPLGVEQSNTSVVVGDRYLLKIFRHLDTGLNPDLELLRALGSTDNTHVTPLLGSIEGCLETGPAPYGSATYGMVQRFLPHAADGWSMALASVRDLLADGPRPADRAGGDFAAESDRLGRAVADVHASLAEVLGTTPLTRSDLVALADTMHAQLDSAVAVVPELGPFAESVHAAFAALPDLRVTGNAQRIHGDLHLGQTLRTGTGWRLVDFEGEPAVPLVERRAIHSPLRDVAGMLRSFVYAAHHQFYEPGHLLRPAPDALSRATVWAERNQAAFCSGYAAVAGTDPRDQERLLRAYVLHKAVYETVYEARNRPGWLSIPLAAFR